MNRLTLRRIKKYYHVDLVVWRTKFVRRIHRWLFNLMIKYNSLGLWSRLRGKNRLMKRLLKRRQFTRLPNLFSGGSFIQSGGRLYMPVRDREETERALDKLRDSLI